MNKNYNLILLTGAGFTHSFGGLLADDMWAEIFNHREIQNRPTIQRMMKDNFDYEAIYEELISGPDRKLFIGDDQKAIEKAIHDAYVAQESLISANRGYIDFNLLNNFITNVDYIFTLNQDLYVEKYIMIPQPFYCKLCLPGIPEAHRYDETIQLQQEIKKSFPDNETLYIKLHGSHNWRSQYGHKMMVIGHSKLERIEKEPLLEWYFELFHAAVAIPSSVLLVIGYGFRDEHINNVIDEAISLKHSRFHVITPEKPRDFIFKFEDSRIYKGDTRNIINGLSVYYPITFTEFINKYSKNYLNYLSSANVIS